MKNFNFLLFYCLIYIFTGIISVNNVFIPTNGYFSLWLAGGFGFVMLSKYGKSAFSYLILSNIFLQLLQFQYYYPGYDFNSYIFPIILNSLLKSLQPYIAWLFWTRYENKIKRQLFTQGYDVFSFLLYVSVIPVILTSWAFVLINEYSFGQISDSSVFEVLARLAVADILGMLLLGSLIFSKDVLSKYTIKDILILFACYLIPFITAKAINNYLFLIVSPVAIVAAYYVNLKKLIPFHILVIIFVMLLSANQMTVFSQEMHDKSFTMFMLFAFVSTVTLYYASISFTELKNHRINLQQLVEERTRELENEITQRKKIESENRSKDRLVNTILSSSPIGITLIKNRRIVWVNDAVSAMLGYSSVEVIFNSVARFYASRSHYDEIGSKLYPRLIKDGFGSMKSKMKHKSGREFDVLLQARPLNTNDLSEGLIFAVVDISELKKTEEELRIKTEKLQDINRELDAFAHSVAHDLKNPLNAIMGFSDLLINEADLFEQEEKEDYLKRINSQSEKMLQIIDTLLLLSGVRKEKVKLEICNFKDIVMHSVNALDEFIVTARAKINVPDYLPAIKSHQPWLEVVMVNLISNAIKYGGNPPEITIGFKETDKHTHIWVQDNGEGITPEKKELLFNEYVRLNYKKSGHGLGLSIVKRIIDRLEGNVFVESEPGKGSRFGFKIPMVAAELSQLAS